MRGALKLSKKAVYSCAESISCMRAKKAGWRGVVIVIMCEALSEKMLFIVGMNMMGRGRRGKDIYAGSVPGPK